MKKVCNKEESTIIMSLVLNSWVALDEFTDVHRWATMSSFGK